MDAGGQQVCAEIDKLLNEIAEQAELIFEHRTRALVQDALDQGRIWPEMAEKILGMFP